MDIESRLSDTHLGLDDTSNNDDPAIEKDLTSDHVLEKDIIAWDDPGEKRNPKNWSMPKRIFHTAFPSMLAFLITFATSSVVPAVDLIAEEFSVSREASILTLTIYTLGIAFGPLFIAPLSETLGRRPVYIVTLTIMLAFTAGAGAAPNFGTLLTCRFLAGFGGSAGVAMGAGTVADIWHLETGGAAALVFILGPFLGPTLGPLAGAYIIHEYDNRWRFSQWVVLMVAAPVYIGILVMKETSKSQILKPKSESRSFNVRHSAGRAFYHAKTALLRPTKMLFTEPIVMALTLYTSFAYAVIFSFFGSFTLVLTELYSFNLRQVGLAFISVIIGYLLAAFMFGIFDKTLYATARAAANGKPAPEHRLYSAMVGSIFFSISLFWYAWEAHRGGHWAALVASGIPFGFGAFALFLSTITYLVDVYRAGAAASALAANGIIRYVLGAIFPLFTLQMYQSVGIHWAGSIFAFASLLLLPIPWIIFRYGKILRAKSHYETSHL